MFLVCKLVYTKVENTSSMMYRYHRVKTFAVFRFPIFMPLSPASAWSYSPPASLGIFKFSIFFDIILPSKMSCFCQNLYRIVSFDASPLIDFPAAFFISVAFGVLIVFSSQRWFSPYGCRSAIAIALLPWMFLHKIASSSFLSFSSGLQNVLQVYFK